MYCTGYIYRRCFARASLQPPSVVACLWLNVNRKRRYIRFSIHPPASVTSHIFTLTLTPVNPARSRHQDITMNFDLCIHYFGHIYFYFTLKSGRKKHLYKEMGFKLKTAETLNYWRMKMKVCSLCVVPAAVMWFFPSPVLHSSPPDATSVSY